LFAVIFIYIFSGPVGLLLKFVARRRKNGEENAAEAEDTVKQR
jgi:hypothetical protein